VDEIVATLEALETDGSFTAEHTVPASALRLRVEGAGPVTFPLKPTAVQSLIQLAEPARRSRFVISETQSAIATIGTAHAQLTRRPFPTQNGARNSFLSTLPTAESGSGSRRIVMLRGHL
jgi:hypothetical protein